MKASLTWRRQLGTRFLWNCHAIIVDFSRLLWRNVLLFGETHHIAKFRLFRFPPPNSLALGKDEMTSSRHTDWLGLSFRIGGIAQPLVVRYSQYRSVGSIYPCLACCRNFENSIWRDDIDMKYCLHVSTSESFHCRTTAANPTEQYPREASTWWWEFQPNYCSIYRLWGRKWEFRFSTTSEQMFV